MSSDAVSWASGRVMRPRCTASSKASWIASAVTTTPRVSRSRICARASCVSSCARLACACAARPPDRPAPEAAVVRAVVRAVERDGREDDPLLAGDREERVDEPLLAVERADERLPLADDLAGELLAEEREDALLACEREDALRDDDEARAPVERLADEPPEPDPERPDDDDDFFGCGMTSLP